MMMTEVEIKQRDRILEAIDQLRRRKARPDSPRICNYMMRRFNVDCKETKSDLQKCVENNIVFKVEYKGDISYRNAAKWNNRHKSDGLEVSALGEKKISGSFAKIVAHSISELICQEPDYLELGVPGPALVKTITAKSLVKYNKKHLVMLIQKEVANGGLIKLENGYFSLGQTPIDTDKSDDEYGGIEEIDMEPPPLLLLSTSLDSSMSDNGNITKYRKKPGPKPGRKKIKDDDIDFEKSVHLPVGFRVGGRKKLAKKVFDPSDNNLPKRKRGRPVGSLNKATLEKQGLKRSPSRPTSVASNFGRSEVSTGICSVCFQVKKHYERMIGCRDCPNKAHQSCLNREDGLLRLRPDNTWQCPNCKTCVICGDTTEAGIMVVCTNCSDPYHSECHIPKIEDKFENNPRWTCINCQHPEYSMPAELQPKTERIDYEDKLNINVMSPEHSDDGNLSGLSASPPALSPQARVQDYSNCSSEYKLNLSSGSGIEENNDSNKSYEIEDSYDPNIPDATHWTYEDVYKYFNEYFPQEASVFRDQEIDGHSLLLMKRTDVLNSLNLKLGPALKIYRHVLKLQVRRDDPKLGWF